MNTTPHQFGMRQIAVAAIGFLVVAIAGFFLGRSTHECEQPALSLYVADVALVDADTGAPVNASVHYPDGFFPSVIASESGMETIPGSARGPNLIEVTEGQCRVTWIGLPNETYAFRFGAEGYETVTLPEDAVEEVQHNAVMGGIGDPVTVPMKRIEQPAK